MELIQKRKIKKALILNAGVTYTAVPFPRFGDFMFGPARMIRWDFTSLLWSLVKVESRDSWSSAWLHNDWVYQVLMGK